MISRRQLRNRLQAAADLRFEADSSSLGDRLASLAAAGAATRVPRPSRWGRRAAALIGSLGLLGWSGVASASAFLGLAATDLLPDPIQRSTARILNTVGIEIPSPEPSGDPLPSDRETPDDSPGNSGNSDVGGNGNSDDSPGNSGNSDVGGNGNSDDSPGNSGNSNAGGNGNSDDD
jgi:hypothetical protein